MGQIRDPATGCRLTRWIKSGRQTQEFTIRVMHCSDFRGETYRIDVQGKHTRSDRPRFADGSCLAHCYRV